LYTGCRGQGEKELTLLGSIGGNNTVVVLATRRSQELGVDCATDYLPEVSDWLLLHCVRIADIALDDFIERKLEMIERHQVVLQYLSGTSLELIFNFTGANNDRPADGVLHRFDSLVH
jgi:hypothetical protein